MTDDDITGFSNCARFERVKMRNKQKYENIDMSVLISIINECC